MADNAVLPGKAHLPVLVEGNYVAWSALLRAHLVGAELWEAVGPESEFSPKGPKTSKKKREQAYSRILETISEPQLAYVLGTDDPREAWMLLEEAHCSTSVNSILSLRRGFFRMTKTETESIMLWISRVRTAALELSRTDHPITELDQVMVITDGLPDEYAHVVSALDALPVAEIRLRDVMTRISGAEAQLQRSREKASEVGAVALLASDRKARAPRNDLRCYNCEGRGHFADDCPTPRPDRQRPAHAKVAQVEDETPGDFKARASLAYVIDEEDEEPPLRLFG